MEFALTAITLFAIFAIGLTSKRYNARVRIMLISMSVFAPMWFFIIWQGAR